MFSLFVLLWPAISKADAPPLFADAAATSPAPPLETATRPEASSAENGNFPSSGGSYGFEEFAAHFAPHEPVYFVGGSQSPNVKFQLSFRYRIFTPNGPIATEHPWIKGFNLAYSQTSLWDLNKSSSPFYDSSYRPELFYYLEKVPGIQLPPSWQFGIQAGVNHESNGRDGVNSRSLNVAYIRPIFTVSDEHSSLFVTFAPKIYDYIGDLNDNPDLARYRGYSDLRLVIGQRDGLQLATVGRVGYGFKRGSVQFDATYPLTKLLRGNADIALDAQYFQGYGDGLLDYNKSSSIFRFGISIVR